MGEFDPDSIGGKAKRGEGLRIGPWEAGARRIARKKTKEQHEYESEREKEILEENFDHNFEVFWEGVDDEGRERPRKEGDFMYDG